MADDLAAVAHLATVIRDLTSGRVTLLSFVDVSITRLVSELNAFTATPIDIGGFRISALTEGAWPTLAADDIAAELRRIFDVPVPDMAQAAALPTRADLRCWYGREWSHAANREHARLARRYPAAGPSPANRHGFPRSGCVVRASGRR